VLILFRFDNQVISNDKSDDVMRLEGDKLQVGGYC